MSQLKELDRLIAPEEKKQKQSLEVKIEQYKKQLAAEEKEHKARLTKDRQEFEEETGKVRTELAAKSVDLDKKLGELKNLEVDKSNLAEVAKKLDERKKSIDLEQKSVEDAKKNYSGLADKAKAKEDLYEKKLKQLGEG